MSADPRPRSTHTQPWYLRRTGAIASGLALVIGCVALRFGWNGIEGPPFPFAPAAYLAGIGGILLLYIGITTPRSR